MNETENSDECEKPTSAVVVEDEQSAAETSSSSQRVDLADFLAANPVPCFANVLTAASSSSDTFASSSADLVYFYKQFKCKCLFARSYSNLLESYLLHQRPSYVPSETEFGGFDKTASIQTSTLKKNLSAFSELVSIPFDYPGT